MNTAHGYLKTGTITVLYKRTHEIAAVFLYIFLGGLVLLLVSTNGLKTPGVFIALANILILAVIVYIRATAKKRSVKSFDAEGASTLNGQQISWSDFRGRVLRTAKNHYGVEYTWRIELIFTENRKLWILPNRLKNYNEIISFVNTLPTANIKSVN